MIWALVDCPQLVLLSVARHCRRRMLWSDCPQLSVKARASGVPVTGSASERFHLSGRPILHIMLYFSPKCTDSPCVCVLCRPTPCILYICKLRCSPYNENCIFRPSQAPSIAAPKAASIEQWRFWLWGFILGGHWGGDTVRVMSL